MFETFISGYEGKFIIGILLSLVCGFFIGIERESRLKPAGISTQSFIIAGAMIFTMLSQQLDPKEPARVAAQVVGGIGFLGAGIIMQRRGHQIRNLTTAASIWFSAAIGILIGFGWYLIAIMAAIFSILVPRIPNVKGKRS